MGIFYRHHFIYSDDLYLPNSLHCEAPKYLTIFHFVLCSPRTKLRTSKNWWTTDDSLSGYNQRRGLDVESTGGVAVVQNNPSLWQGKVNTAVFWETRQKIPCAVRAGNSCGFSNIIQQLILTQSHGPELLLASITMTCCLIPPAPHTTTNTTTLPPRQWRHDCAWKSERTLVGMEPHHFNITVTCAAKQLPANKKINNKSDAFLLRIVLTSFAY